MEEDEAFGIGFENEDEVESGDKDSSAKGFEEAFRYGMAACRIDLDAVARAVLASMTAI